MTHDSAREARRSRHDRREGSRTAGTFGEEIAAAHLEQHGFTCLEYNFRTRFGEIDIIAANERFLLFVEVKTRAQNARVSAAEAVDARKQARLRTAAEQYLVVNKTQLQPRFDVIAVETNKSGQVASIRWIENAF